MTRRLRILTLVGLVASVVLAVGYVLLFRLPSSGPEGAEPDLAFERVKPPSRVGTIRGRCRLERPVVRWRVPAPRCNGGGTMLTDSVVATDDGDLGGCVVWLDAANRGSSTAAESTYRLEARADGFRPHVGAALAPVQVAVANTSGCDFNVHGYRETLGETQFNFSSAPGSLNGDSESAFLQVPATYLIHDDIHPTCSAYVHVFATRWFDVTSADPRGALQPGEFLLKDVPPGEHEVVAWHESMRRHEVKQDGKIATYSYESPWTSPPKKVHVVAGKATVVDFTIPVPAEIPSAPDVYVPR